MREIYLYSPIYDFVAENLISQIEENMSTDITLRENTPGGSVFASYGIYKKISEHGNVHLKVDGCAMSGGAFLPLFVKSSECLDVSRFLFHRADMYVANEEDQAFLDSINADLKAKMKQKINPKIFKEVTGYSYEDLFDPEKRIDITLTGAEAKKIGLIDKVIKLTPAMQSEITALNERYAVAAQQEKPLNKNTMTLAELKAKHPDLFKQVRNLGIKKERDRVLAFMAFSDIDAEAVKKGIEAGKPISQKELADFTAKGISKGKTEAIKSDSEKKTLTTEEQETKEKSDKEKNLEAFRKAALVNAGIEVK